MEKTALNKANATKYTVYFPIDKKDEGSTADIRKHVLDYVLKVFGGATIFRTEGTTAEWGDELTYVLEILVEYLEPGEIRIEQLAWLILCYLDNSKTSRGKPPEKTVWFYEQPVTLYKLNNPDLVTSPKTDDKRKRPSRSSTNISKKEKGA